MATGYPRWEDATGAVRCRACRLPQPPGSRIFIKSKNVYYCDDCGVGAEAAGEEVKAGGIEEAFLRDLNAFPDEAGDLVLAKSALYMAHQLDQGDVGPREVTLYTKEIRLSLLQIRELYPPDDDDDMEARREKFNERRRREQNGI